MTNTTKNPTHSGTQPIQEETVLKIAKEVAVKFIETGRMTPATFKEQFPMIYTTIEETVKKK